MPLFILIYFAQCGFIINPDFPPLAIFCIQGVLTIAFGSSSSVTFFRGRCNTLLQLLFIEADLSSGSTNSWIFHKQLIPHLYEDLYISFSQETVSVLTLIGQLGIFSLFIEGTKFTRDPPELTSITREIGGLIGKYFGNIGTSDWWLLLFPSAVCLILYFSAYLLSRKLEKEKKMGDSIPHLFA